MSQAIQYRRLNVRLNLTSKDLGLAGDLRVVGGNYTGYFNNLISMP